VARSTNEPGFLSSSGAFQFLASLEPILGDDCKVLELLAGAKVIEPMEGGWHCPLFARLNAHLAENFKRPCDNHREHPALPKSTEPGEIRQIFCDGQWLKRKQHPRNRNRWRSPNRWNTIPRAA